MLALALASFLPFPRSVAGAVIERVVAVVDGRPLMLSEVRLIADLRGLDRKAATEALIDEQLMFREATRLVRTDLKPADETRALASLEQRAPEVAAKTPEADLRRLALREATILKYIDFRFRPLVRVDPDELQKAYDEVYGGKADAPPLTAVEDEMRARRARQELDQQIEAWIKELRAQATIRYNP